MGFRRLDLDRVAGPALLLAAAARAVRFRPPPVFCTVCFVFAAVALGTVLALALAMALAVLPPVCVYVCMCVCVVDMRCVNG